jgi:hypothetical protein
MKEYDKLIQEEINEDEDKYEFDDDENDIINDHYFSNNLCNINTNMKKIEIYFYFKLSENNEYIFPVESDLLDINSQYGYDLIENIIKNINKKSITIKYNSKQYIVSLKDCEYESCKKNFYMQNYELKFCNKKNMKPKIDLPPISLKTQLFNISDVKISLISKYHYNIMLIEKLEDNIDINNIKCIDMNNNSEKYKKRKCFNICLIY